MTEVEQLRRAIAIRRAAPTRDTATRKELGYLSTLMHKLVLEQVNQRHQAWLTRFQDQQESLQQRLAAANARLNDLAGEVDPQQLPEVAANDLAQRQEVSRG